jgi:hypothetical protein
MLTLRLHQRLRSDVHKVSVGIFGGHRAWRAGLALALLSGGGTVTQANAATQGATAAAITLRPLSIVKLRDLNFGTLIAGTSRGTVVINPDTDARTTTGGVTAAGGAPIAAQFYTYATGNQLLLVYRGALPVLNRVGGGATMAVTGLTLNGPVTRFVGPAGLLDLRVGGTLQVEANQLSGSYSGSFDIIVVYQ